MTVGSNQQGSGTKKTYEPIPANSYTLKMTRCEEKATKKGDGAYLNVTFEVVEGDHSNRLVFEKFMIDHPSAKVVEIGRDRLNKFLRSVGVKNGLADLNNDTNQVAGSLHKLVIGKVAIEAGTNGYADRNKITSFAMR